MILQFLKAHKASLGSLLLLCVLGIATCCSGLVTQPGTFLAEPNRLTLEFVVERHDAYVLAEEDPGDAAMLAESAQLSLQFAQNVSISVAWFEAAFEPVAERHDAFINADPVLLSYQRSNALRSTEILRSFYEAEDD